MALWTLKGKKILIIDDFAEMRSSLRNMLTSYGADEITAASTGEEAIDLLCHRQYDIVLCDYNLGEGKDGQQVLEEVKFRNRLPYSTVFIMVTAESTSMMVMGALEYQPDEYLAKPFTRQVLQGRLEKQLKRKAELAPLSRALAGNNTPKALELCDQLIAAGSHNRNELLKLKCELLIDTQEYDLADALCDQILAERPILWVRYLKGKIQSQRGNDAEAAETFKSVLQENGNFIAAYDALSECQRKLKDYTAAQQTLLEALEKSPKSVVRQRTLAQTAEQNDDLAIAEQARRRAIRFGKNSVLREPTDYTKLAEVQVENGDAKDALRTIELMKSEFKSDNRGKLAASLAKNKIYNEMNNTEAAAEAAAEAIELFEKNPLAVSNEMAMELTEVCLKQGNSDEANKIALHLANNNHDNKELLDDVSHLFSAAGSEQAVGQMIEQVRRKVAQTNNQGVELLESGKLDEAVALFEQALTEGENNHVLNLNTAQAYLMKVKKHGDNADLMEKARSCLDKIQFVPRLAQRYKVLNATYWKLFNASLSQ